MSRSTISTFKLFELFPDEQSARKYRNTVCICASAMGSKSGHRIRDGYEQR